MPRTKRAGRKASQAKKAADNTAEETPPSQEVGEDNAEESRVEEEAIPESVNQPAPDKEADEAKTVKNENDTEEREEEEKMEEANENQEDKPQNSENEESKAESTEPGKKVLNVEDWPVTPYRPHTIPSIADSQLKEKWEWHMRIYPIDATDIKRCVLDSVSKIAQETWFYIDKNNYGMGSYDLCMRSHTDAAMVMLKTLHAPMMYRYVTVEVSKRGKNPESEEKIRQNPPPSTSDDGSDDQEDRIEEAIENLPYTEVLETAILHLDYCHTYACDKIKGKEKKRSLYVKYLPESTSKELLKVLFPVAISLDIISTEEGRSVGDLDVVSMDNLEGIVHSYVAVHINGRKDIALDWNKENIDDGKTAVVSEQESPWEVLPRHPELPYEQGSELEKDDVTQFSKRKRDMEIQQRKAADKRNNQRGERRRESRWDGGGGLSANRKAQEMIHMQMEMNNKIQSQLALLHAVGENRMPRGRGGQMMGRRDMGPMDVRDRKRDRFERDRMEMPPRRGDFPPWEMEHRPGRMGPRDRDLFEGGRGRGGFMGGFGGPSRFDFDHEEMDGPRGLMEGRGRGFEPRGRGGRFGGGGRGGSFGMPGRERFGSGGRGLDMPEMGGPPSGFNRRGGMGRGRNGPDGPSRDRESASSNKDQRGSGQGVNKDKPVTRGFPSNQERSVDDKAQPINSIGHNNQGGNKGQNNQQRPGNFNNRQSNNNRFGNSGNQGSYPAGNRPGSYQGSNKSFGSQNQRNSFGSPQGQSHSAPGQNRNRPSRFSQPQNEGNFGSSQDRQSSFGGSNDRRSNYSGSQNQQQSNYGSSQNQQRGFGASQGNYGASQNQQTGYGTSGYHQSGYENQQNSYNTMGNQGTGGYNSGNSYSTGNQQNSFGSSMNQQSYGSSQSQQSGFGSTQQNAAYGTGQNISNNQQSGYGSLQSQSFGSQQQNYGNQQGYSNQQSYGSQQNFGSGQHQQQSGYGSYNSQQQQPQQQSYTTMQQQQSYNTQTQGFGSTQGFGGQQQATDFTSGFWGQQSGSGDFSQNSFGSQQTSQMQDYGSYSQQGQAAYQGYNSSNNVSSAGTGYGADSAFANQGLYSATQTSGSYGGFGDSSSYNTSNPQQSNLATYNFASYSQSTN